ncbi:MAG: AraC family transcriptional regulator [Bacteroidales bacterium]|nr:AraC family transcriptional regulator [Bacteroidales bacterium]
MYSRFYNPLPVLKDFLKYYIIFDTYIEDFSQLVQCTIPNYCPFLILTISDKAPTFVFEDHIVPDVTEHIGGQIYSPIYMAKPGNFRVVVVLFQANGAYHLFGTPQSEILNQFVTLQDLLDKKSSNLRQKIHDCKTNNNEIIRELNSFFLGFLKNSDIRKSYIDHVLSQITKKKDHFKIEIFCNDLNINPRSLRRDFRRQVGMPPKVFIRMLRLNMLHKYLLHYKNISIHDLVYQLGYFDQSHLINDFKKYAHYAPGLFTCNDIVKHFIRADSYYDKLPA